MQYPSILNHIASCMGNGILDIRLCKDKCINDAIVGHRVPHHYKLCPNRNLLTLVWFCLQFFIVKLEHQFHGEFKRKRNVISLKLWSW